MFLQRAIISLTLGPLFLYLTYLGRWYFAIPVILAHAFASTEISKILGGLKRNVPVALIAPLIVLQMIPHVWEGGNAYAPAAFFVAMLSMLLYALWRYEKHGESGHIVTYDWFSGMMAVTLLGWSGSHLLRLRGMGAPADGDAWKWTLLAVLTVWSADTFAYLTGKYLTGKGPIGKHKLTPRLSPNKTIEGLCGAVIMGTIFGLIGGILMGLPLLPVAVVSIALCFVGTAGDLSISLLKRESGVKDSGSIIPGHGGFLDRLDSILWGIPLAYYLLMLFQQI